MRISSAWSIWAHHKRMRRRRRDDWSAAVTPVTGFFAPTIQWRRPINGHAQVTRAIGAGPGEGVNFIYSSRVRFSPSATIIIAPRCQRHIRDLSITTTPLVPPLSHARRLSIYLSIYTHVSHSSATPPPIWYIIYMYTHAIAEWFISHSLSLSLSLTLFLLILLSPTHPFRIVSDARARRPAGYRGIFGFFSAPLAPIHIYYIIRKSRSRACHF